jgi:hypothetical protein
MSMVGRAGGAGGGFNRPTTRLEKRFLHTNYWIFFDDNKDEASTARFIFTTWARTCRPSRTESRVTKRDQAYTTGRCRACP